MRRLWLLLLRLLAIRLLLLEGTYATATVIGLTRVSVTTLISLAIVGSTTATTTAASTSLVLIVATAATAAGLFV